MIVKRLTVKRKPIRIPRKGWGDEKSCYIDEHRVCHKKNSCPKIFGSYKKVSESECESFPKCKGKCEACFRS